MKKKTRKVVKCEGCDKAFMTKTKKRPEFTGWQCHDCAVADFEQYVSSIGAQKNVEGWLLVFDDNGRD